MPDIPWLNRPPTVAEVQAHAAAHPAPGPEWTSDNPEQWGLWLMDDGRPRLVVLTADKHGVWLPDGDDVNERRCPGAKWLACTAEGIPVCLLPTRDPNDAGVNWDRGYL